MDLWTNSALSEPLIPLDSSLRGPAASASTRIKNTVMADNVNSIEGPLDNTFQKLLHAQTAHREELQNMMSALLKDITGIYVGHLKEQLNGALEKQAVFLRNQFAANLNWRLIHHHTEVRKDIKGFMTPVVQSVDDLHNDLWKLSQTMDSVSQEMVTVKRSLTLSALSPESAPVQTQPNEAQRQRLQSTMKAGATDIMLESPGDSPVLQEVG